MKSNTRHQLGLEELLPNIYHNNHSNNDPIIDLYPNCDCFSFVCFFKISAVVNLYQDFGSYFLRFAKASETGNQKSCKCNFWKTPRDRERQTGSDKWDSTLQDHCPFNV